VKDAALTFRSKEPPSPNMNPEFVTKSTITVFTFGPLVVIIIVLKDILSGQLGPDPIDQHRRVTRRVFDDDVQLPRADRRKQPVQIVPGNAKTGDEISDLEVTEPGRHPVNRSKYGRGEGRGVP
jgi:hypothetical protein